MSFPGRATRNCNCSRASVSAGKTHRPDSVFSKSIVAAGSFIICLLMATSCRPADAADEHDSPDLQFFREQVEPLLRQSCYGCHSHAAGTMEGDLALDWKSGWQQGGTRGTAVFPGKPDESLLIQAVRHTLPDLKMPEQPLSDQQIQILEQWVRDGAADPRQVPSVKAQPDADWWSLKPLIRPQLPAAGSAQVNLNPIDQFINQKLEQQQLMAVPAADRRTLIRRLSVDLHGILPTPEQTQKFVESSAPAAWDDLINEMLAAPMYGERWARHWMDTIHYADSHGFEHDVFRPHAWRFRDYLIRSLNQDLSWQDQIRAQLAADVFFADSIAMRPAIGFLGAGTYDHSAASTAPKNFENLDRDDMVTQTMTAFAGITVHCARCHDHKFDPVSQREYYSLQAVFAGIGKGDIPIEVDPEIARQRARWTALRDSDSAHLSQLIDDDLTMRIAAWERAAAEQPDWQQPEIRSFHTHSGTSLQLQADGSLLADGSAPATETIVITAGTSLPAVTAVRLEVLTDDSLPAAGPGRAENGNLHLSEVEIQRFRLGQPTGETLQIAAAMADFEQDGWLISHAIDGKPETAWGIHPQEGMPHSAVFVLEQRQSLTAKDSLMMTLRQDHGRQHVIGRLRVSVTDHPQPGLSAVPADVAVILNTADSQRTAEQKLQLNMHAVKTIAEQQLQSLPDPVLLYAAAPTAVNERGTISYPEPRTIHVLKRGNVEQPGEVVTPGALQVIQELDHRFPSAANQPESARRAALANWLAAPENPLTWRTIANRVWHFHFGRGLCDTPSDLGRMGGTPSHPELLDWLACEIRDTGSLKHLHQLILTSAAWQRSSQTSTQLQQQDPDNRFLARRSRMRLDADAWRDSVLRASGQLNPEMGGPAISYFSTSPGAQLTPILDYNNYDWDSPDAGRRSIYRVVWRGIPDPVMEAMDFPDLGLLTPTRSTSVSPLQSLTLMNNRFVLHQCQKMAEVIVHAGVTPEQQIADAVHRTWQRHPQETERAELGQLARSHGLAAVCRLLLNSSEFLSLD